MSRLVLLAVLAALVGCDSSPGDPPVFSGVATDLPAPPGQVSRYAIVADSAGATTGTLTPVDSANSIGWDLAFRGPEILLNGGASGPGAGVGVVVERPFDQVTDALFDGVVYRRDGESPCPSGPARAVCTGAGEGWFETLALPGGGQALVPRPTTTLLLRRGDGGGYAKLRIASYYRGAPDVGAITAASEPGFFTVQFAVDPDGAAFE